LQPESAALIVDLHTAEDELRRPYFSVAGVLPPRKKESAGARHLCTGSYKKAAAHDTCMSHLFLSQ
jgi:hypothetical protein